VNKRLSSLVFGHSIRRLTSIQEVDSGPAVTLLRGTTPAVHLKPPRLTEGSIQTPHSQESRQQRDTEKS
jgi:hypothetical protein